MCRAWIGLSRVNVTQGCGGASSFPGNGWRDQLYDAIEYPMCLKDIGDMKI
jgi:hypothetical protein